MAKIKFDVTGSDPEKARAGTGEPPRPGVYPAVIKSMTEGFSKDENTGKPDKERPRIEVVFALTNDANKGFPLWQYLTFGEASLWKYDQFLQAFNLADDKKRKGEFDTDKLIGKPCRVRVKAGSNQQGDYKPDIGAVMPAEEGDLEGVPQNDDDFTDMGDGDDMMDEGGDDLWTEEALLALDNDTLKATAAEYEVATARRQKKGVIADILKAQQALIDAAAAEGGGDDDMIEDDDIMDDDAPASDALTREQLQAMEIPELKEAAKKFDVATGGKRKGDVIDAILEAQGEVPF